MRFINFLIKPASSLCNMRCRYCFYEDIAANREEKCMGIMTRATVDHLLQSAFEEVGPNGAVSFAFQGGEPTLAGLPYFRYFTARAVDLCPPGVQINFSIQTNGILVDGAWADLFQQYDFLVGLSMDGCKEVHNLHRVTEQGAGTWNRLCKTLAMLQRRKVRVNVLCVVTAQCARRPEKVYSSLKKLGVDYMQFIPCMDPMDVQRGEKPFSLTPQAYGTFLCRLFDLWYHDWATGQYHSIRLFDDYIHMILGDQPGTCATCGQCGSYFVVEGDGSVYPCDFYVLDAWKLGTLGEHTLSQLAQSPLRAKFLSWGSRKPDQCGQCRWRSLCNGGCKHDWVGQPESPRNYFCTSFIQFFSHAETKLLTVAQAEQAAQQNQRRA